MASDDTGLEDRARSLAKAYAAKARAELADADRVLGRAVRVKGSGDPLGRVLLVKGTPGPGDMAAGVALAGADGEAARKALEALGQDPLSVWATCSRPGKGDRELLTKRVALVIEAVDPAVVLALDGEAAEDVAAASGVARLPFGTAVERHGRILGAVDGLEASLADPARKSRVWRQMRAVFAATGSAKGAAQD